MNRPKLPTLAILTATLASCAPSSSWFVNWSGSIDCAPEGGRWDFEVDTPSARAVEVGLLNRAGGRWEETIPMEAGAQDGPWTLSVMDERLTCGEGGALAATVLVEGDQGRSAVAYYDGGTDSLTTTIRWDRPVGSWDVSVETTQDMSAVALSFWDVDEEELVHDFLLDGSGRRWSIELGCLRVSCDGERWQKVLEFWDADGAYLGSAG